MMMTRKGLPLDYNQAIQEDKEGLFDALDTLQHDLHIAAAALPAIFLPQPLPSNLNHPLHDQAPTLVD